MSRPEGIEPADAILLRDTVAEDIPVFFDQQLDADANNIGKEHWGKGVATRALSAFLERVRSRPLHAWVAKDNIASIRVLQKCGFTVGGEDRGFANARGVEIEEFILRIGADDGPSAK